MSEHSAEPTMTVLSLTRNVSPATILNARLGSAVSTEREKGKSAPAMKAVHMRQGMVDICIASQRKGGMGSSVLRNHVRRAAKYLLQEVAVHLVLLTMGSVTV